ncbi:hypothetical protein QFZ32_003345 [Streptomyces canus]|nr:hypothetical protein [Streptomyces canus]MDQ0763605.1 hypothetical protein [Streptomyces canus]MDQ1067905.1 hypothetical protein [Streptomyces canus]
MMGLVKSLAPTPSYETVENHPPEVLDLLAGATLDLSWAVRS